MVEAGSGVTVEVAAEKSNFETVTKTSHGAKSWDFLLCFSSPATGHAGGEVKFMGEIVRFWEIFCLTCIVEFYFLCWQWMKETGTQTAWPVGYWSRISLGREKLLCWGQKILESGWGFHCFHSSPFLSLCSAGS